MTANILLVDDDDRTLRSIERRLKTEFQIFTANGGRAALELVETARDLAVVVADMKMPGMSGIELLSAMKNTSPETVRLMLTGDADIDTATRAINEGHIFRFLNKPCSAEILYDAISEGVAEHERIVRQRELENELRDFAYTDHLTKVNNRRRFLELAQLELKRARRFGHALSIGMMDLDHFKEINDSRGHAVGDRVLETVAQVALASLRDIDVFGRYGGEEFVMLLVETNIQGAVTAAERVRTHIAQTEIDAGDGGVHTTVSIGLASLAVGESLGDVLERADKALYYAKVNGRNRTEPLGRDLAN